MMPNQLAHARGLRNQAWENEFNWKRTNYDLRDGAAVTLLAQTLSDQGINVPAGVAGVVRKAKLVRRSRTPGVTSHYFASVDVDVAGKKLCVQVPHGALRIVVSKDKECSTPCSFGTFDFQKQLAWPAN